MHIVDGCVPPKVVWEGGHFRHVGVQCLSISFTSEVVD
jgi:hypothetical protein